MSCGGRGDRWLSEISMHWMSLDYNFIPRSPVILFCDLESFSEAQLAHLFNGGGDSIRSGVVQTFSVKRLVRNISGFGSQKVSVATSLLRCMASWKQP